MQIVFRCLGSLSIVLATFAGGEAYCKQDIAWPSGTSVASEMEFPVAPGVQFTSICTTTADSILGPLSICAPLSISHTGRVAALLRLNAATALVIDQREWRLLYSKEAETIRPIASITKLMNAMVVLDAGLPLDEVIQITKDEIDSLKGSTSRLGIGIRLTRRQLLDLALMASENRAAAALARNYPSGRTAFVAAMNAKARALAMYHTHFVDPTGLNPGNVSTAHDLAIMADAAFRYSTIRHATTTREQLIATKRGRRMRILAFHNSNRLVSQEDWHIGLSKTGYIREAGRCLVLQSVIADKAVIIVLLDSIRKATRVADANYIKEWLSAAGNEQSLDKQPLLSDKQPLRSSDLTVLMHQQAGQ